MSLGGCESALIRFIHVFLDLNPYFSARLQCPTRREYVGDRIFAKIMGMGPSIAQWISTCHLFTQLVNQAAFEECI
jgi:hypothetical protein